MNNLLLSTAPKFSFFAILFKKPTLLIATTPILAIAPAVDFIKLVYVLAWLFIVDLISGLLASYFTWRQTAENKTYFFGSKQGFSSDKFKKCFIKGMVYGGFPLIVLKFQQAFMLKSFSANYITDAQIDVTTVILLFFCGNETYSIFWENLPKCGLDIPQGLSNLFKGVRNIKNEIKNEE